jgi:putative DNA primase/helicase
MKTLNISQPKLNSANSAASAVKEKHLLNQAEVISMDKVTPLDIDWLWPDHIPLGMLTLIAGDPGVGKSFLTLYMAATVSTGRPWPDSQCFTSENSAVSATSAVKSSLPGSVIILNNEDSPAKVITPRLSALGADLSKIKMIPFVWHRDKNGNEFTDYFNIVTDLFALEMTISEMPDLKLIIIDPLSAFFGCLDTQNDIYVRAILTPLVHLAHKYNVAIVGVMHLNKGTSTKAAYRTMGSLAFPAAARTVWIVNPVSNAANNPRRLFIPAKHNLLEKPATLAFEIKDNSIVFENQPVDISAEVVLSSKSNIEAPELNRAIDWLKNLLADGKPKPSKDILKLAEDQCFKNCTIVRARKELDIKCFPHKDEYGNKFWCWKLHIPQDDLSKKINLEALRLKSYADLEKLFRK